MNNARRKQIRAAIAILEAVQGELENARRIIARVQQGGNGQKIEENAGELQDIESELTNGVDMLIDRLHEVIS